MGGVPPSFSGRRTGSAKEKRELKAEKLKIASLWAGLEAAMCGRARRMAALWWEIARGYHFGDSEGLLNVLCRAEMARII
jgi:hypothetical protein